VWLARALLSSSSQAVTSQTLAEAVVASSVDFSGRISLDWYAALPAYAACMLLMVCVLVVVSLLCSLASSLQAGL
jgi:hypothetical protein